MLSRDQIIKRKDCKFGKETCNLQKTTTESKRTIIERCLEGKCIDSTLKDQKTIEKLFQERSKKSIIIS